MVDGWTWLLRWRRPDFGNDAGEQLPRSVLSLQVAGIMPQLSTTKVVQNLHRIRSAAYSSALPLICDYPLISVMGLG
jgi:hypothetical protein